jgi:hypothetical protein
MLTANLKYFGFWLNAIAIDANVSDSFTCTTGLSSKNCPTLDAIPFSLTPYGIDLDREGDLLSKP